MVSSATRTRVCVSIRTCVCYSPECCVPAGVAPYSAFWAHTGLSARACTRTCDCQDGGSARGTSTPLPPCARIRVRAVVYLSAWVCPGVCRRVQGEGQSLGPVPAPASGGSGRTSWGAGTPLQLGEEPAGGERKGCAGVIDATVEGMDVLVTQNGVCGCARERGLRRSSGTLRGPDPPQQARPARGPRASPRRTRGKRDPSPAARGPRAVSDTRRRQRLYFSRLEPRPRARDGPHGDADSAAAIFPISPESIIRRD